MGWEDNVVIPQINDEDNADKNNIPSPLLRTFNVKHFTYITQPHILQMCVQAFGGMLVSVTCCAGPMTL